MKKSSFEKKKLFKNIVFIILFFFIAFFSYSNDSNSASFRYSEFDFKQFAENNLGYWTNECSKKEEDEAERCIELVLSRQEKFYTKLYKVLAKYQNKGILIDDKIILTTVFFELDPDLFTDEEDSESYQNAFGDKYPAFRTDESDDLNEFDNDPEYFKKETDTIKTLAKSMLGYSYTCYGVESDPTLHQNEDESTNYTCDNGGDLKTIDGKEYCVTPLEKGYNSFWQQLIDNNDLTSILGVKSENKSKCEKELAESQNKDTIYDTSNVEELAVDKYWDFLLESDYFDKRSHLQYRYASILEETNHEHMMDLSDPDEVEEHIEDIKKIRSDIVDNIKDILENYGEDDTSNNYIQASSSKFWWPVGSKETTAGEDGILFATGTPSNIGTSDEYGFRIHPTTGEYSFHSGLDITSAGLGSNVHNIIAVKDGIVTKVYTGCLSSSNSCPSSYGNHIDITHADGYKTRYAHLHENTITVSLNEAVQQGQVIAKMGNSGRSTGAHLHFEVRTNENVAVNPRNFIDPDNPRPEDVSSSLVAMLICMEGAGANDGKGNYIVYDDNYGTLTVGPGVTLEHQVNRFSQYGIDSMSSTYYKEGALIPKNIVDRIKADILNANRDSIITVLSRAEITLEDYQIDALVSRMYNVGNINGFVDAFIEYGNTEALYTNYLSTKTSSKGKESQGLANRRTYEWALFHSGIYHTC